MIKKSFKISKAKAHIKFLKEQCYNRVFYEDCAREKIKAEGSPACHNCRINREYTEYVGVSFEDMIDYEDDVMRE